MDDARGRFIPAAGRDWAMPLYDPLVRLIGGDRARAAFLDLAEPRPGEVVLDIGCGTGSLAILVKRRHPAVEVIGLDPDPRALARASRKVARAELRIRLDRGFADALPYPSGSFDRVFSCFVYHHLGPNEKEAMLSEARRVLKPGGSLWLLDFDGPEAAGDGPLARWLHSSPVLAGNDAAGVLGSMRRAGLEGPKRVGRGSLVLGHVAYSCFAGAAPSAEARHGGMRMTIVVEPER